MKKNYESISYCRICDSDDIELILNLGGQPPANSLYQSQENMPLTVPLRLMYCNECKTVQLGEDVDPEYLFGSYLWITGTSSTAKNYSKSFVQESLLRVKKEHHNLFIVEIASNDGTFLDQFQKYGCKVLGIDPATNIAKLASDNGIPTLNDYFNLEVSKEICKKYTKADLIFARNVIPHVKEIHSVISGINNLLSEEGIGIIEFHNAGLLLDELHYDYIYHEHLFYYTLTSIEALLKMHDLNIFDISNSPISGGSWVVYFAKKSRDKTKELIKAQASDLENQNNVKESWFDFANKAKEHAEKLTNLVLNEVENKGKIVAYGASARSSTLLNFCGIDSSHISVIIDKNPLKEGLYTAGSNIPIVSYDIGLENIINSDVVLLLAWNFKDEIINDLRRDGFNGKFILPLPGDPHYL